MNINKNCFLSLTFLFASCIVVAQTKKIDSLVVDGIGQYKVTIADATKITDVPVINDSTKKIPVKGYDINTKRVSVTYDVLPITAAEMSGEPLTKLYNGLVKIGFGSGVQTKFTPYGEFWYNNLRSKEYAYGIRMKHFSTSYNPKDLGFAGFSDNEISLYGKKFLKEHSLIGNFDYNRNVLHYYGFNTELFDLTKDYTVQRFNLFAASAELMSHYTSAKRYNHDVKLSYYNLADIYKSSENNIKASGYVQTAIDKEMLRVNASVDYYNYKTKADTVNNTIISLNPNFIASGDKYKALIGVTATLDMFEKSNFYFYPNVELSYNIFEDIIIPYAGVTGALQKNSYKTLTDKNPFVLPALNMLNTNKKYDFFGGLKGTLSSKIAYNAMVSYASVNNFAMYVNDTKELPQNRFNVIYDNAELLNVRGEVAYQNREKLRIALRGDYYNYKTKNELRAWYVPQVQITASANYNLRDKIVVKADLFYFDNQYAKIFVADSTELSGYKVVAKELKGVFDANIGVEYRYTKKLGFYLNVNNIANIRYNRWLNYPTQRFGFMLGLSYSF
jgi:hypothetical protein